MTINIEAERHLKYTIFVLESRTKQKYTAQGATAFRVQKEDANSLFGCRYSPK